eukprot:2547921-Amphidinium_carterae.1
MAHRGGRAQCAAIFDFSSMLKLTICTGLCCWHRKRFAYLCRQCSDDPDIWHQLVITAPFAILTQWPSEDWQCCRMH